MIFGSKRRKQWKGALNRSHTTRSVITVFLFPPRSSDIIFYLSNNTVKSNSIYIPTAK